MLAKIDDRDLENLASQTSFRMPELHQIWKRFKQLDSEAKGYVTIEDI